MFKLIILGCVQLRAGHCDDTPEIFTFWNNNDENDLRFELDEMICTKDALRAGKDFCPVAEIIFTFDNCLVEADDGREQPSDSPCR